MTFSCPLATPSNASASAPMARTLVMDIHGHMDQLSGDVVGCPSTQNGMIYSYIKYIKIYQYMILYIINNNYSMISRYAIVIVLAVLTHPKKWR
jgi:hypothetical protein